MGGQVEFAQELLRWRVVPAIVSHFCGNSGVHDHDYSG